MLGDSLLLLWEDFFSGGSLLSYSVGTETISSRLIQPGLHLQLQRFKSGAVPPFHVTLSWPASGTLLLYGARCCVLTVKNHVDSG